MNRNMLKAARGRGFTLVELMVAMAIALLLTVVIGEVFLNTRRSSTIQDDQARMQENTRFAVQTISRIVRQSSFRSYVGVAASTYFPYATAPAITGTEGGTTVSDQITVRFQGSGTASAADSTILDCLGTSYAFGATGMSTFAIRSGGSDGNGLFCTADDPTSGSAVWQELVPGVENMQILYGQDTDADRTANVYQRISDISSTSSNLDNIVSARFALLLRSPTDTSQVKNTNSYTLNGVSVGPFNDGRVRRVVNFTVNLRNRTP